MSGTISSATNSASPWAANAQQRATPPQVGGKKLDAEKLAEIGRLASTDRHVRAHEAAHLAVAGSYAVGGPSYTYAYGPDGQFYAVGGEVTLDTGPDPSGPEATVQKAKIIQAAADAPADPSTQDQMVAAQAEQMEATAELQLSAQQEQVRAAYRKPGDSATAQLIAVVL